MCKIMEDLREEGRLVGREETAVQMLKDGVLPYDKIALYAGISLDRIKSLEKEVLL